MTTKKLNLVQLLLKRGRYLHDLGVSDEAARIFQRLLALADLPVEAAEEIQGRLAEIRFEQGRFRRARRHLSAALAYQPDNAHYHYMMALAAESDPDCALDRAFKHFRRSVELDPEHPEYLCALGLTALSLGRSQQGLRALRRAQQLAPDDPAILEKVVEGLGEVGEWTQASEMVRAAMFRHPRAAAYRQLWQRLQFDALHAHQQEGMHQSQNSRRDHGMPVILPLRPKVALEELKADGRRLLRKDAPSSTAGPKRSTKPAPKKR